MTASIQHIEKKALSLPREARTRLAIHLLESIEERPNMDPRQVELAWLAEANRRFQAYQPAALCVAGSQLRRHSKGFEYSEVERCSTGEFR